MPYARNTNWMDPLNRLIWFRAFSARKTTVTLRDGRVFNINYDKRKSEGLVWVEPANGKTLVPCGWFVLKDITHPAWVTETGLN